MISEVKSMVLFKLFIRTFVGVPEPVGSVDDFVGSVYTLVYSSYVYSCIFSVFTIGLWILTPSKFTLFGPQATEKQ